MYWLEWKWMQQKPKELEFLKSERETEQRPIYCPAVHNPM